jgi:hypothetical protein
MKNELLYLGLPKKQIKSLWGEYLADSARQDVCTEAIHRK